MAAKADDNGIVGALKQSDGVKEVLVALQVNPYGYLADHAKPDPFGAESAYNEAILDVLVARGVEMIAVTDHHRIDRSTSLLEAARSRGIVALPGFEAGTKEGIHVLLVFDSDTKLETINRYLGACGIHSSDFGAVCDLSLANLLKKARDWKALAIAAHVISSQGLLKALSGAARAAAWRDPNLYAASISGPIASVPDDSRNILANKNPEYKRERPVAIINASDVSSVESANGASSCTYFKVSQCSVESLRQACLDPRSRIRLSSDPRPDERIRLVGLAVTGGFLDGLKLKLNPDLNILIGGRGTGKSSVIEAIRFALDLPTLGADARENQTRIVKNVIKNGSKISIAVYSPLPSPKTYFVERSLPDKPLVYDERRKLLDLRPDQVVGDIRLLGQHEIAEIVKQPATLTRLLESERSLSNDLSRRIKATREALENNRHEIVANARDLSRDQDEVGVLSELEERVARYAQAGVEKKLADRTVLIREESVFKQFDVQLNLVDKLLSAIVSRIPIAIDFAVGPATDGLPFAEKFEALSGEIETINKVLADGVQAAQDAVAKAREVEAEARSGWDRRRTEVEKESAEALRELAKDNVDANDFLSLKARVAEIQPLAARLNSLETKRDELLSQRRTLRATWSDLQRDEFASLEHAAKQLTKKLGRAVRVTVAFGKERSLLADHFSALGGRTSELKARALEESFSIPAFAEALSKGVAEVVAVTGVPSAQAERAISAPLDWRLRLDEILLGHTTDVQLNVGTTSDPEWRGLADLSTGQKATAILLLLLIQSSAPLIIDQPEDDLDNRFISEEVVEKIREAKKKRQFLFATHNANIPVLGDAEQIAALRAKGDASGGRVELPEDAVGGLDKPTLRPIVEEVLEGGKLAFEMRRMKYGFE